VRATRSTFTTPVACCRNRLAACKLAKVTFTHYEGIDPDTYALTVNIARRHMSSSSSPSIGNIRKTVEEIGPAVPLRVMPPKPELPDILFKKGTSAGCVLMLVGSCVSSRPLPAVDPVSYTHLDVYKRQLLTLTLGNLTPTDLAAVDQALKAVLGLP